MPMHLPGRALLDGRLYTTFTPGDDHKGMVFAPNSMMTNILG